MEKICVAVRLRPLVFEDSSNGASGRLKRIVFCFTGFMTHHSLTLFMLFGIFYFFFFFLYLFTLLRGFCNFNLIFVTFFHVSMLLANHVFDETSTHGFYELLAKDIIHAVLNGFNGMFLIYEQI
ncbi:hypothetical protein HN873_058486 [Arachis hypogaea]